VKLLYREAKFEGMDEDARTASFVASTETPVEMGFGPPEVLRMSGVRLRRFRANPVVLDAHDRSSIRSVIGRAEVHVDRAGRELHTRITYAPNERGEEAWNLVRGGFVRAVSIGYAPNDRKTVRLREDEEDGDVRGPAYIVREWELLEVSNVPVPADSNALRRARMDYWQAFGRSEGAPEEETAVVEKKEEVREPAVSPDVVAARVRANLAVARREQVLAFTPSNLRALAEGLLLEDLTAEEIRAKLIEERAATLAPVGTPEPAAPAADKPSHDDGWGDFDDIPGDVLVRSF